MPRDRITIGLYSTQSGENFNASILNEIVNIKRINEKFTAAANTADKEPPEIVISVLLIPDWENHSNYDNPEYLIAKNKFIESMRECVNQSSLPDVVVEDFYTESGMTDGERNYLNGLITKGSNADMIKMRAIIDNQDRHHLQMDSNTQIHDYNRLYQATFAAAEQADALPALNASYYDSDYISAHNKIVYTTPQSPLAKEIETIHIKYCQDHCDDHLQENTRKEKTKKSSIYARDFVIALDALGLTNKLTLPPPIRPTTKVVHPANLANTTAYRLTKYVVTSVNRSWKEEDNTPEILHAKKLPSVQVGDAFCDYASFYIALKKFVRNIGVHKYGQSGNEQLQQDIKEKNYDALDDDKETRQQFFALSNLNVDRAIIGCFYDNAVDELNKDDDKELAKETLMYLATLFLDNLAGKALTKELFDCTPQELHSNPWRHSLSYHAATVLQPESAQKPSPTPPSLSTTTHSSSAGSSVLTSESASRATSSQGLLLSTNTSSETSTNSSPGKTSISASPTTPGLFSPTSTEPVELPVYLTFFENTV